VISRLAPFLLRVLRHFRKPILKKYAPHFLKHPAAM